MNIVHESKKFLVIGALSTVLNYALFLFLYKILGAQYVFSSVAGYLGGFIFGYIYNRSWTFKSVRPNRALELLRYFSVYLFSLALSVVVLRIGVERFVLSPLAANILAIGVSTVSNFLGSKFWVFSERAAALERRIAPLVGIPFLAILAVKIVASFLFGSHFATEGFIPFITYFVSTLDNPYDHFVGQGLNVFPYPAGMLLLESLPFFFAHYLLPSALFANLNFQLFLLKAPMLVLDILIYLVLCYLLPFKEKKVLWFYFASPILFYITYFHAQLDIVPTAFLFLSLLALFRNKETLAFILLGLGIAAKTHLLAAVPFYAIYFYRNNVSVLKIARLVLLSAACFLVVNPYLGSEGFIKSVFNNVEQQRLFNLAVPFGFQGLEFLVAPAAILFFFYKFASYKKINKDFLLVTLGIVFVALISLVPPMQGWFWWALPFLVFFFIKFRGAPTTSFWFMNAAFLLYFFAIPGSDIFESLSPIIPTLAEAPTPFYLLSADGVNMSLLLNLFFTVLEASLLVSALWVYRIGNSSNRLYQSLGKPFVVGVGGDSAVGKTRLTQALEFVAGPRNTASLRGDDAHKWERGHENWKVTTHLNPKGNNVHLDLEHVEAFLQGESVERPVYDHSTGKIQPPVILEPKRFIFFEGLMPFVLERMRRLFTFKIYVEVDETLRGEWKQMRDSSERKRSAEEIRQQIEERRADAERFIHPQKDFADLIVRYSKSGEGLMMECLIKNSIFVGNLTEELEKVPVLTVDHQYVDLNFQKIAFRGRIEEGAVAEIAWKLFPNMADIFENLPQFKGGFEGVLQLFFVGIVTDFYKYTVRDDERVF